MKISAIQNLNNRNAKPLFKAGVTDFFSDFDGTFMPHKYRHDVFCNNLPNSPRKAFLESGKKDFQDYFDSFGEFLDTLRGKEGKKLSFTITSGRNRPEFNYYLQRIRNDGLKVPIPDRLVIRNGGDIYTRREGVEDYFNSGMQEAFLKSGFSQSKRDAVKEAAGGWDGDKIREIIAKYLKSLPAMSEDVKTEEAFKLWPFISSNFEQKGNIMRTIREEYDKLLYSDMSENEIAEHIHNSAKAYKESKTAGLDETEAAKVFEDIDGRIRDIAYKITKAKQNGCTIFEADTDGVFYADGMHFDSKRKMLSPVPENWAAFKDNGNLEFHINFPSAYSNDRNIYQISDNLYKELRDAGFDFAHRVHESKKGRTFGDISVRPLVNGEGINKLFDTKAQAKKIMEGKLNDLVLVAGDDKNDLRMLDLFEYIDLEKGESRISEKNLRKIYDLPVISIYVDNAASKTKEAVMTTKTAGMPIEELEQYFNSDGNIRFIHVIPDNTVGKPKSLLEGAQIAVREYAKRNPEFRKNLSPEMKKIIENIGDDYPVDKAFTEELEKQFGTKLWNPAKFIDIAEEIGAEPVKKGLKKSHLALIACGVAIIGGIAAFIKNKKAKNANNEAKAQEVGK